MTMLSSFNWIEGFLMLLPYGYQFDFNQGQNAVATSKAASGLLGSGSLVTALDQYGTGLAQQYGQAYVGNLLDETKIGATSANALANTGQAYANASNSNSNSAANVAANADLSIGNNINNLLKTGVNAFGASQGGSSYLAGGGANPQRLRAWDRGVRMSENALKIAPVSVTAPFFVSRLGPQVNAMTGAAADPGPLGEQLARLGPEQRAFAARQMEMLGAISQGLAGRAYPERRAILRHMAPQLAAQGVPPAILAAFDPTDANLATAAGEAEAVRRAVQPG